MNNPLETDPNFSVYFTHENTVLHRTLSLTLNFLAFSFLSFWLGQCISTHKIFTRQGLQSLKPSTVFLFLLLLDSWAFVFASGILVHGIGTSLNHITCSMVFKIVLVFYGGSKGIIYLLLLEKVFAVWPQKGSRLNSSAYRTGFLSLPLLGFMMIISLKGHRSELGPDHQCRIGVTLGIVIFDIICDFVITLGLSFMFLLPLRRYTSYPRLHRLARRNLFATIGCMSTTLFVTIMIAVYNNKIYGWTFIALCNIDLCVNSSIAYWVTQPITIYSNSSKLNTARSHTLHEADTRGRASATIYESPPPKQTSVAPSQLSIALTRPRDSSNTIEMALAQYHDSVSLHTLEPASLDTSMASMVTDERPSELGILKYDSIAATSKPTEDLAQHSYHSVTSTDNLTPQFRRQCARRSRFSPTVGSMEIPAAEESDIGLQGTKSLQPICRSFGNSPTIPYFSTPSQFPLPPNLHSASSSPIFASVDSLNSIDTDTRRSRPASGRESTLLKALSKTNHPNHTGGVRHQHYERRATIKDHVIPPVPDIVSITRSEILPFNCPPHSKSQTPLFPLAAPPPPTPPEAMDRQAVTSLTHLRAQPCLQIPPLSPLGQIEAQTSIIYDPFYTAGDQSEQSEQSKQSEHLEPLAQPSKDCFNRFGEEVEPTRRPSAAAVLGYYILPGRRPSECTRRLSEWDLSSQAGFRQSGEIIVNPDVIDEALDEVEMSYQV